MAEPRTAILKRDGSLYYYENYTDARADAITNDVIVVYADLNEQIKLKDNVDVWIYPGVILNNTTTDPLTFGPTITDKNNAVDCKIYGMGKIINSSDYSCISIEDPNSKLSIECDSIEGVNSITVNISPSKKFHLKCNYVYSEKFQAIRIGNFAVAGMVDDVRLEIHKVETGSLIGTPAGTTALSTRGNGFIRIDEIICNNNGHCLSHQEGMITARIKKMSTKLNTVSAIAAVHLDQGTGTQKLILYFDEILNFSGIFNSGIGIHHHQGTGIFIGRKVYSEYEQGIDISGNNTIGYVKCDEIISLNKEALRMFSIDNQITVVSNYIEGIGFSGCVYLQDDSSLNLKNAKLVNKATTSDSKCIVLEKTDTLLPRLELNNIKAVTGNTTSGSIIFLAGFDEVTVKNYGLFTNKELGSGITLEIGDLSNFLFIESTDLD